MALTKKEAYHALELPFDEDLNLVQSSYKRLASKWHPGKHKNSAESQKKFKRITRAYRFLAADESDDDTTMTLDEMLNIFQQTVTGKSPATANGYGSSDEGDDEDEDDCFDGCERPLVETKRVEHANELISEEEKERRRAEKRRAKKKRRRERKKLEKLEQQPKQNEKSSQHKNKVFNESQNDRKSKKSDKKLVPDTSEDEAAFDPSSAFFANIVNKKKKNLNINEQSQVSSKDRSKDRATLQSHSAKSEEEIEELDTVVLRSRKLAIRGNEMAQVGHYNAAIDLFTEAIRLDPTDFRFFGNRSYCYERIQQYDKALKDAEKSILISPNWPKGYFRKARALAGQKQYSTAEKAFLQVVRLDKNCEDAKQELLRVRTYQITEMGFTKSQAEAAINQHGTVQAALDSLLNTVVTENSLNDGLESDESEEFCVNNRILQTTHTGTIYTSSSPMDTKMNSALYSCVPSLTNPEGLTALWVGNVLPEITEKKLNQMFSKHGHVTSVRCLPNRFCAFINFKTKESAGKAMNSLQGTDCGGQKLLIKFPDNPIINGSTITLRKSSTTSNGKMVRTSLSKQSGPVNGDECYFWRTTGCQFGDKCHYRHMPNHKGIDLKPWHKVK